MAAAAAIWAGALAGGAVSIYLAIVTVIGAVAVGGYLRRGWAGAVAVAAVGLVSGAAAADRVEATLATELPQGTGVLVGVAQSDAMAHFEDFRFVLQASQWSPREHTSDVRLRSPVAVITENQDVIAGDVIRTEGLLVATPGLVRGDPVAGRMRATTTLVTARGGSPLLAAGNWVRQVVQNRLDPLGPSPQAALLAGFLIGDVAALPASDHEALRRSGLSHFVAVSGSNVALVLGAWWLVLGPIGAANRMRAATGLAVLAVFVVATRWESSVIRAATMAGLVLGGRAVNVPLDAWTALGGAITILLAFAGDLAYDVGFQLSAAATAGVLVGMHWWSDRPPRILWSTLAATTAAQLAVMPLLLIHFGSVPLLAPVANVVAAPLVTVATACAGAGVIVGWSLPLSIADALAAGVLSVARIAGDWPQLTPMGVVGVGIVMGLGRVEKLRLVVVGVSLCAGVLAVTPPGPPEVPVVTFLDVGQGDAILLRDPSGAVVLVDGGRDPVVLGAGLRRYGVRRIDLLVATHGDADHVGGFSDLDVDVGRFWLPRYQERSAMLADLVANLAAKGVTIEEVAANDGGRLGSFRLQVLGPTRRYAAENDGSVVLWVTVAGASILLPGDIGALAQEELAGLDPDVLLVPHHGAATTDLGWLGETVGPLAVISVGTNSYGHPAPEVEAVLERTGAVVRSTREEGDISIRLGNDP